jgi:hypothetical protein
MPFEIENAMSRKAMAKVDQLILNIIENNHRSLIQIIMFGSYSNSSHMRVMSTCERLVKWDARSSLHSRPSHDDLKRLYQSCRHFSHLSLSKTRDPNYGDQDKSWMKGRVLSQHNNADD